MEKNLKKYNTKEGEVMKEKIKLYDKELTKTSENIKNIIILFIVFTLGFVAGICGVDLQLKDKNNKLQEIVQERQNHIEELEKIIENQQVKFEEQQMKINEQFIEIDALKKLFNAQEIIIK